MSREVRGVSVFRYLGQHRRKLKPACCVDKPIQVPCSSEEMLKSFGPQQGSVNEMGARNKYLDCVGNSSSGGDSRRDREVGPRKTNIVEQRT